MALLHGPSNCGNIQNARNATTQPGGIWDDDPVITLSSTCDYSFDGTKKELAQFMYKFMDVPVKTKEGSDFAVKYGAISGKGSHKVGIQRMVLTASIGAVGGPAALAVAGTAATGHMLYNTFKASINSDSTSIDPDLAKLNQSEQDELHGKTGFQFLRKNDRMKVTLTLAPARAGTNDSGRIPSGITLGRIGIGLSQKG